MPVEAWWLKTLCVAFGGAVGALSRWGISHATHVWLGHRWPLGTLVVNVSGCFLFALVFQWLHQRGLPSEPYWRLLILTGYCGALTTFSTLAFDLYELHVRQGFWVATLNMALHLGLGMGAVLVGLILARSL